MPEISVIVPVYNTAKYLEPCLRSIATQTFGNFEVIVVNDGSTDESLSIIHNFMNVDNRIKLINQENKGLSEARNTGLRNATGRWVTFLDSDDAIAPNFLERTLVVAKATKSQVVCCGKYSFRDGMDISNYSVRPSVFGKKAHITVMPSQKAILNAYYQKDKPDYSAWNKLFSMTLWQGREFPAGKFFEDMATIPGVFKDAKTIAFVNEPLYLYRKRSSGILATKYTLKKAELLDIAEQLYLQSKIENPKILRAAESNLFSASCSILKRTPNTQEFADYRNRAWNWIQKLRRKNIINPKTRFRNKVAALCSMSGKKNMEKILVVLG